MDNKIIKKIFTVGECEIPTPTPEILCPVSANIIEACDSDTTIVLTSGSTNFNKNIEISGTITKYNGLNLFGKTFSGSTDGMQLVDFPTVSGEDKYTVSAILSGNTLQFNRTDETNAYEVDLSTLNSEYFSVISAITSTHSSQISELSGITNFNTVQISTISGITSQLSGITSTQTDQIIYLNNNVITGGTYNNETVYLNKTNGENIIISGFTDNNTFITAATYNPTTKILSLDRNDGVTLTASGWTDDNTFLTGGTFVSQVLTLNQNNGSSVIVTGFTDNDIYVTGGTFSAQTLTLRRNDGNNVVVSGFTSPTWGAIEGTLSAQTDLNSALNLLAPKDNPTFTGTITATQIFNSNSALGALTMGTGSAPVSISRNTANNAPVFRVRNLNNSSTGNIAEFTSGSTSVLVAGVRPSGNVFGPSGTTSNDYVTLSQIPFKIKNGTPTSVYTGTVQQIIYSHLIPANTFKVGTVFQVKCWIDRGAAAAVSTLGINFYIGSTASSLVFNNICGSHTRGQTAGYIPTIRTFTVEAGGIRCIQWNLNTSSDELIQVAASNIRPFNYTQDQYFIVAGTNANAADTYQGTIFTLNADL